MTRVACDGDKRHDVGVCATRTTPGDTRWSSLPVDAVLLQRQVLAHPKEDNCAKGENNPNDHAEKTVLARLNVGRLNGVPRRQSIHC
jgi:hypothetical protein